MYTKIMTNLPWIIYILETNADVIWSNVYDADWNNPAACCLQKNFRDFLKMHSEIQEINWIIDEFDRVTKGEINSVCHIIRVTYDETSILKISFKQVIYNNKKHILVSYDDITGVLKAFHIGLRGSDYKERTNLINQIDIISSQIDKLVKDIKNDESKIKEPSEKTITLFSKILNNLKKST